MIYLFVITTFVFLALWLQARSLVAHYRFLAGEAIETAKELVEIHETYQAEVNEKFAGIREASERIRQRGLRN
jgi:hypothetical protein